MTSLRFYAAAFVLCIVSVASCGTDKAGNCAASADTPETFCYCPRGESCSQVCAVSDASCSLDCANQNQDCSLTGGDGCIASCQGAANCTVACRRNAAVACQYIKGECRATVGENARVACEGAHSCNVTCTGSCAVDCLADGKCRVACVDIATCSLTCGKDASAAAACPDGKTKVCGLDC